jgi:hypothetical protein
MSTGTDVVDQKALEERMRKQAADMKAKIGAPGGDKIRLTKTKKFKLPSGVESGGPLTGVIVDFVAFNAYFDRPFSDKDKTPPACYALGAVKPAQLVPSASSPVKQSDACKGCWANEFGTKGGGKACGNHYLLGFVEANDDASSPLYLLQLGPKTLRHWETYANGILLHTGFPPISVVTEIFFDPSEENQVLRFNKAGPNPNLGVHMARQESVLKRLLSEPDVSGYVAPPKAPGPKGK